MMMKNFMVICMMVMLSGCSIFSRLGDVGRAPEISKIENPTKAHDYEPVDMPMPVSQAVASGPNSLWRGGASGFYKDQRAFQIGDIITVNVSIKDAANLTNTTSRARGGDSDNLGVKALGGLETKLTDFLPSAVDPTNLLDITSSSKNTGNGSIKRDETVNITMAAIVTQVLQNGNLVISGLQEVRVNHELRQLRIDGVIRRADISSGNSIKSDKIAELRVSYGGKGVISDVQQPRYGRQILEVINPF